MLMLSTPSASAAFHAARMASTVVCWGRMCTPTLSAAIVPIVLYLPDTMTTISPDQLEEAMPALMAQASVPGVSVASVSDGAVAWQSGFGVRRAGAPDPVTAETLFQAASLSKPVFAYAVLDFARDGLLDLDIPLTAYLPEPFVEDDELLHQVTARHVLSHTTGWPNWRPRGEPLHREASPGERFGYSGGRAARAARPPGPP